MDETRVIWKNISLESISFIKICRNPLCPRPHLPIRNMLGHSGRFGTITPACSICHDREIGSKCINFGSYGRLVNENTKKRNVRKKVCKKNYDQKKNYWSKTNLCP